MPPSGLMAKILLTIAGAIDDAVGWPFTEPSSRMYRKLNGVGRKWVAKLALRLLTTSNARSTAGQLMWPGRRRRLALQRLADHWCAWPREKSTNCRRILDDTSHRFDQDSKVERLGEKTQESSALAAVAHP